VTMQWIRDSLNAGKPMSLSRRVDTVLYRPLPYSLPVPAFRSQVCHCGSMQCCCCRICT